MEANEQQLKGKKVLVFPRMDKIGLIANASELLEEARKANVECLILAYRRKDGTTRTYRHGDPEPLYITLDLLKRDLIDEYCGIPEDEQ